jgi:hypothetical protein
LPRSTRAHRRDEWLAELDAARAEGGALAFALFVVLPAAPRMAVEVIDMGPGLDGIWLVVALAGGLIGMLGLSFWIDSY